MTDGSCMVIKSEDALPKLKNGLGFNIFQRMQKFRKNVAQFNFKECTGELYDCVLRKSIRTALKLKDVNLGEEPIVAICADHCDTYIPMLACFFLGYRVLAYDSSLSKVNLAHLVRQVKPDIMFIDEDTISTMREIMEDVKEQFELVVFGVYNGCSSFQEYLQEHEGEGRFEPVKIENEASTACIMFSSGTTGLQKAMTLPNGGLLQQALNVCYMQDFTENSRCIFNTKITWITSVILSIACNLTGAARIISPREDVWEAIDRYKVSHIFLSPFLTAKLLELEKPENIETDSVKSFFISGYRLSPTVEAVVKRTFPKTLVVQSYGQTEASGWISMFNLKRDDIILASKKIGSVGTPLPGISCKVIDIETGKKLGRNQIGELRVKCDHPTFTGYINNDTSNQFDSEGWLKTGDLVYFDNDDHLYINGRYKELLKYRSFHVEPVLLENILESHPEVDQAIVIGIEHEIDGDHPLGVVTLKKGCTVSSKSLENYVHERVQEQQRLRAGIIILDEMPLTPTGKPLRRVIKELIMAGKISLK